LIDTSGLSSYGHEKRAAVKVLETERLGLHHLTEDDAEFILRLLNEPSFLRYIGDKKVRTLDDARAYILSGPAQSYRENGFGLYRVERKQDGAAIGICGLVRREGLPDPDVGFAFLPEYWNQGYALESAAAVMKHARDTLRIPRILAITSPDNEASERLLNKIGLRFERLIRLSDDAPEVKLFKATT
jgi:RimJ/RimL family protein N-acetyltransferase